MGEGTYFVKPSDDWLEMVGPVPKNTWIILRDLDRHHTDGQGIYADRLIDPQIRTELFQQR